MALISIVVCDSVDVGACAVLMLWLERVNTKSAESAKSSSGVDQDIGAIICEGDGDSRSIHKVHRSASEMCFEPN